MRLNSIWKDHINSLIEYTANCLFISHPVIQGHDQSSTLSQHTAELTLPKHSPLHRDLLRYAKLMEWLKNTQKEKYEGLSRVSAVLTKHPQHF